MVYKIIKEILNLEDVSDKDKISMITEMTEKFEAIDDYAEEMALKEGREVTFEDEYNATFKVASEMGISFEKNEHEITEVIIEGLNYIVEQQSDNGGWGRAHKARIPKRLHSYIKDDNFTPLPSAWVTTLAMSTLADGSRFIKKTSEIDKAVEGGVNWLIKNQDSSGAWRDADIFICESPHNKINLIQTGMAICGLVIAKSYFNQKGLEPSIDAGLKFIEQANKNTGGWPSLLGKKCDSKATSISTIACVLTDRMDLAERGVKWLLDYQKPEGDWGYNRTSDSFLFGIYYGIEALIFYRMINADFLKKDQKYRSRVDKVIRKALNWYVKTNKLVIREDGYHWGWDGGDKMSDISNTATAIIVLLDCEEDDFSFVIREGIDFLLDQKDENHCWYGDTSLVVKSLIRFLKPESRYFYALPKFS